MIHAGAASLLPDNLSQLPHLREVVPSRPPSAKEGYYWAHRLSIRPVSLLLNTIGSPGKGQRADVGLPLRDSAPPRKPLLAEARDRDCSLPARASTIPPPPPPSPSVFPPPALPPWPRLCGVGRSWSSYSAYCLTLTPGGRNQRNLAPQPLGHQPGRFPTPCFRGRTPLSPTS